jgi:hypothetical protein
MRDLARRAVDVTRWAPESAVAIVLGVLFTALGLLHAAEGDTLSEVTLLVLSVFALAVIRDRVERTDAAGKIASLDLDARAERDATAAAFAAIEASLRQLDEDVQALASGEPYHVIHYTSAMNIRDGGSLAYGTRTKRIRFDQNSVLSISDQSESTGTTENYECSPRPLKRVGDFGTGGKLYSLISLGRPWNRGEELEFTIEETLRNAFLSDREDVTVEVKGPMDELVISVTWAGDRAIDRVFVDRYGRQTPVDESERQPAEGGGFSCVRRFDQPQVGETISIVWDWAE